MKLLVTVLIGVILLLCSWIFYMVKSVTPEQIEAWKQEQRKNPDSGNTSVLIVVP